MVGGWLRPGVPGVPAGPGEEVVCANGALEAPGAAGLSGFEAGGRAGSWEKADTLPRQES